LENYFNLRQITANVWENSLQKKCEDFGNSIEDAKKDHKSGMSQEDTQAR
jgi:hypothetical protein